MGGDGEHTVGKGDAFRRRHAAGSTAFGNRVHDANPTLPIDMDDLPTLPPEGKHGGLDVLKLGHAEAGVHAANILDSSAHRSKTRRVKDCVEGPEVSTGIALLALGAAHLGIEVSFEFVLQWK